MEERLSALLQAKDYDALLESADKAVANDPNNVLALSFKAKALAFKRQYQEAHQLISTSEDLWATNPTIGSEMKEVDRKCQLVLNFIANYSRSIEFPEDWYASTLQAHLETSEKLSVQDSVTLKHRNRDAYILGIADAVNRFRGFETCVYRKLASSLDRFPCAQASREGWIYQADQIYKLEYSDSDDSDYYSDSSGKEEEEKPELPNVSYRKDIPVLYSKFPSVSWEEVGPSSFMAADNGETGLDAFFSMTAVDLDTQNLLCWSLDQQAKLSQDFFVPMYQNVIDPNLTAVSFGTQDELVDQWTATNFMMEEVRIPKMDLIVALQLSVKRAVSRQLPWHSVKGIFEFVFGERTSLYYTIGKAKIQSQIGELEFEGHPELYLAVENVLSAAAPMLAKLRTPALLLPGPLQAVVKAQRIYLNPGEEYSGVWHYDGMNERIVAVVLYFYRYSPGMEGGALEFLGRQPRSSEFWIGGDCSPDSLDQKDVQCYVEELPRGKVPVEKGLLCVFSNYQNIHRVLKMVYPETCEGDPNAPGGVASRDFLAMFIVDQRAPLNSTEKALSDGRLQSIELRQKKREHLFVEQITPSGRFGIGNGLVYSTGNGCCGLMGWLAKQFDNSYLSDFGRDEEIGARFLHAMNFSPPLGRGVSWALEGSWMDMENEEDD